MFPPTGLASTKAAIAAIAYTATPQRSTRSSGGSRNRAASGEQGHPDEGREDEWLLAAGRKGERQRAERAERRKRDEGAAAPIPRQHHGDARERQEQAGNRAAANGEHGEHGGEQRTPSLQGEQRPQADRDPEGEGEAAREQHRRRARAEPQGRQAGAVAVARDGRGRRTARRPSRRPGRRPAAARAPRPSGGNRTL